MQAQKDSPVANYVARRITESPDKPERKLVQEVMEVFQLQPNYLAVVEETVHDATKYRP